MYTFRAVPAQVRARSSDSALHDAPSITCIATYTVREVPQACYAFQPSRYVAAPLSLAMKRSAAGRRTLLMYRKTSKTATQQLQRVRVQ